jgi:Cytochrome C oxidase, cbb3-type, subunit III
MTIKTWLALIGFLAIVAVIGAGVFFFGGYFNVAAAVENPGIVNWALARVRAASIARQATDAPPGALDDPARVQNGARAYSQRGCPTCHGGPGVNWQKFSEGLNPDPPDLKEVAGELEPPVLFWAIKNGIKMTGMPSFGKIEVPDDEIWSIVAFVKRLPKVSDAEYKSWTAPPVITTVPR